MSRFHSRASEFPPTYPPDTQQYYPLPYAPSPPPAFSYPTNPGSSQRSQPSPASSKASSIAPAPAPVTTAVTSRDGVVWKSDWKDWPAMILSIAILGGWIAGAVYARIHTTVLPLTFWDTRMDKKLANGNYNTLIALAGALAGAVISFGIGQGCKEVLRRRIISSQGISLYSYSAWVKYSGIGIQFKLRTTAVFSVLIFALVTQFSTATQAAFGTSVILHNISHPVYLPRLSDNVAWLNEYLAVDLPLAFSGELLSLASIAYTPLERGYNDTLAYNVDGVIREGRPSDYIPAIDCQPEILRGTMNGSIPFTGRDAKLVTASSGSNYAYVPAEGMKTNVVCEPLTVTFSPERINGTSLIFYEIHFPCQTLLRVYDATLFGHTVIDAATCPNSSDVLIFNPIPTNASLGPVWQCSLSILTAVFPSKYGEAARAARILGPGEDEVVLPNSEEIGQYLGYTLWNTFGTRGSVELAFVFDAGFDSGFDLVDVASLVVMAVTNAALVKMEFYLQTMAYQIGSKTNLAYQTEEGFYEVHVLKLHLAGWQILWVILPAALLGLVLFLSAGFLWGRTGSVDFTDPVQVAILAMASPYDSSFHGGSAGEFEDPNLYRPIKIAFGRPTTQDPEWAISGRGHSHLTLSTPSSSLQPPNVGELYS